MKRLLALTALIALLLTATACGKTEPLVPSTPGQLYTELGVALEQTYMSGGVERNPWDIEMYNSRLYVGSGDYDRNYGPVNMWYYDFKKQTWEIDCFLEDEQASRFKLIDGKLYVPGIDPKASWDMGTYYVLDGENWKTYETLPNAAHNFDMIKHDGKLFAGLGAKSGCSPILVTTNEETWEPVELYKDGSPVDTAGYTYVRVYDFLTLKGELYAYFSLSGSDSGKPSYMEIYRYDGEKFVFYSDMPRKLDYTGLNTYAFLHQRVEFKGYQYLTTGKLYRSADMITPEAIAMDGDAEVNDLRVIGKKLYVLCSEEYVTENGDVAFYNSLRVTKNGKTYTEVFRFSYPVRALCFTYQDGTVFLGMGFGTKATKDWSFYDENGMILAINQKL